jgi:hypothetical protein
MVSRDLRCSRARVLLIRCFAVLTLLLLKSSVAQADGAAFDLSGPSVEMKVTRGGKPLPISEVPNLQPGDRLWIHPVFPEDQSARFLLIVAFLRGTTNPPPENWFTKADTWKKEVRQEGIVVTVPQEAQQALLFLAPETSGDFSTLRSAVRSKPGVFVRASQDLNQASLDRSRLEKYLAQVRDISDADPQALHERSILLARTLGIRLEQQCFERPLEQQAACLTQNRENLVLDDGHIQSMVAALTSGPNSDLIGAVTATPLAGSGFYSAYVGAVVDLARVMGNIRTAAYQYIPALALPKKEQMNLKLNNPPSFRKPMSVIVVGLPAIEAPQLPPLRAVDAKQVFCLQKSSLVLPVEGAPLVFSADIAHDFVLHVTQKDGSAVNLPARADAANGGFVVDTRAADPTKFEPDVTGKLQGFWGFEGYDGPNFRLRTSHPAKWMVPPAEQTALIVGRDDTLHLQSPEAVCADTVTIQDAQGKEIKTPWKLVKPEELELKVVLKDASAGPLKAKVRQFGLSAADDVPLQAYAEAAHLEAFAINAGDSGGILKGTRLDEVERFELKDVRLVPAKLVRAGEKDELRLAAAEADSLELKADERVVARVTLKDGRTLDVSTTVGPPRPKVTLVSKSIRLGPAPSAVALGNPDELPLDGELSFLLKTQIPERFPRGEKIEVATADESFSTMLSVADNSLLLEDPQDLVAVLEPRKAFGDSGFGALRFRPVAADGGKGDWQRLATLVRVPTVKELRCPASPDKPCQLSGTNLFLIDSLASDAEFTHTAPVPGGFLDSKISVPHPGESGLYIKLRDDPGIVSTLMLPVLPENQESGVDKTP